jgi:hypothetical protein
MATSDSPNASERPAMEPKKERTGHEENGTKIERTTMMIRTPEPILRLGLFCSVLTGSAPGIIGGVDFGPPPAFGGVTSKNLTPDTEGKPAGLTLEQFETALRTGHDPLDPKNGLLAVMPWPIYRHMTGRDLDAIYAYLSSIPSAETPNIHCKNAGQ